LRNQKDGQALSGIFKDLYKYVNTYKIRPQGSKNQASSKLWPKELNLCSQASTVLINISAKFGMNNMEI